MLRAILAKLKGSPPDPTTDWPRLSVSAPAIDSSRGAVGELHFGDDIQSARKFGRPERFRWTQPAYCELLYAKRGFQLDFDSGRFAYAAFFVGPDACLLEASSLAFSTPRVDSTLLSQSTTLKEIEAAFGVPSSQDREDDETVLFYARRSVTLEFEASAARMLKRVNVYPTQTTKQPR